MAIKNRRARLLIPVALCDRLKQEIQYLNLDGKVRVRPSSPSDDAPQSRGDLIRRVVSSYVDWCEMGNAWEIEPGQETDGLSYYFLRMEVGRWEYAVKQHFAESFHQLAALALDWWFRRMDAQTLSDRDIWAALMTCPLDQFRATLKEQNESP